MKATNPGGSLVEMTQCYIKIGNTRPIYMKVLPEISDSKRATYTDESVIGRAFPMKTYSHSDNRVITWTIHFVASSGKELDENIDRLRLIESAVYPRRPKNLFPYQPPPICQLKCGMTLAETPLCAILENYSVKFPTDVAWSNSKAPNEATSGPEKFMPYKFDVDLSFHVVYDSNNLPSHEDMLPGSERLM